MALHVKEMCKKYKLMQTDLSEKAGEGYALRDLGMIKTTIELDQ